MIEDNSFKWNFMERFKEFIIQAMSIFIDCIFLCFWVFLQHLVEIVIEKLQLSAIHHWTLIVLQVAFALASLFPVIIYIYKDIYIMVIRTQRKIEEEKQDKGVHKNDG